MDAPTEHLRFEIAEASANLRAGDFPDPEVEAQLDDLLDRMERQMGIALDVDTPYDGSSVAEAEDQLAAVDAWAALISSAVGRVYAPASPWPRHSAGWDKRIVRRLRKMANKLRAVLAPVAKALGAVGFSISVSFPWGIAIGLSF